LPGCGGPFNKVSGDFSWDFVYIRGLGVVTISSVAGNHTQSDNVSAHATVTVPQENRLFVLMTENCDKKITLWSIRFPFSTDR
jgi:hypothetical protein